MFLECFWDVLECVFFCDIPGCPGTYLDVLGCFRKRTFLEHFLMFLGFFGKYWDVLEHFGTFWDVFGMLLDVLGCLQMFWDALGSFGKFRDVLGSLWMFSNVLIHFGMFWVVLGLFYLSRTLAKWKNVAIYA